MPQVWPTRIFRGPAVQTERIVYESGEQIRLPAVRSFAANAPANFKVTQFGPMAWDDVEFLFTMPYTDPSLTVDEQAHGAMVAAMRASAPADLKSPLSTVGVWQCNGVDVNEGRVSMSGTRHFFGGLVAVFVLRGGEWGSVRCSLCSGKAAQCVHCGYAAYLCGHAGASLLELRDLAVGRGEVTAERAEREQRPAWRPLAPGRQPDLPSGAAWLTMASIRGRAAKKTEARAASARGQNEEIMAFFETPQRGAEPGPGQAAAPTREALNLELARDAASREFTPSFQTLSRAVAMKVTYQEANASGLGKVVKNILRRNVANATMLSLCAKLMEVWAAQAAGSAAQSSGGAGPASGAGDSGGGAGSASAAGAAGGSQATAASRQGAATGSQAAVASRQGGGKRARVE